MRCGILSGIVVLSGNASLLQNVCFVVHSGIELMKTNDCSGWVSIFVHLMIMFVQQCTNAIHYYETNSCRVLMRRSVQKKMNLGENLSDNCDDDAKQLLENSACLLHHKTTSEMSSSRHMVYKQMLQNQ